MQQERISFSLGGMAADSPNPLWTWMIGKITSCTLLKVSYSLNYIVIRECTYRTEGTTSYNEVQREMREMKNQLAELKQMMRVSFDLQMDIQRSIRQEVSAALSMVLGSPSQTSTSLQSHAAAGVSIPNPCPIPTLSE